MSLGKSIINLFSRRRQPVSVRARYDSAVTDPNNARHWAWADYRSADLDASAETRKTLRIRARYEANNNAYAHGIAETLAYDLVGTGIRLQVKGDTKNTQAIEQAWSDWCDSVRLFAKLRTARYDKVIDGEAFILLTSNPAVRHAVKLDIRLIDADRVTSGIYSADTLHDLTDGIKLDKYDNPVSYSILDRHPTETYYTDNDIRTVPAEHIIHIYNVKRAGQHRGVSELAPCLDLFGQLRDYTQATLTAAQVTASLTGALATDQPAGGEATDIAPMENLDIVPGKLLTLPAGWKFEAVKAEQPTSTYAAFKAEILGEIARCLQVPYNIAAGNCNGGNFSSSMLDLRIYRNAILMEQQQWSLALDRIFETWYAEYKLTRMGLPRDVQWGWIYPAIPQHSDPAKTANAERTSLQSMTKTLASVYAERGLDWETDGLQQIAKEVEMCRQAGLSHPAEYLKQLGDKPGADDGETEEDAQ